MFSLICSLPGVAAIRAGMMNSTLEDGLPSASSITPKGCLSLITKVLASGVAYESVLLASTPPKLSRLAQRLMEATTSSLVTLLPS